jgi:hypothetical protein
MPIPLSWWRSLVALFLYRLKYFQVQ